MIVLQTLDVEIVVSRVILGTTCFNYVKSYTWCVVFNGHNGEFCVYLSGLKTDPRMCNILCITNNYISSHAL